MDSMCLVTIRTMHTFAEVQCCLFTTITIVAIAHYLYTINAVQLHSSIRVTTIFACKNVITNCDEAESCYLYVHTMSLHVHLSSLLWPSYYYFILYHHYHYNYYLICYRVEANFVCSVPTANLTRVVLTNALQDVMMHQIEANKLSFSTYLCFWQVYCILMVKIFIFTFCLYRCRQHSWLMHTVLQS